LVQSLTLGSYELAVAEDFGPRIIGLRRNDSPDFFARLDPELALRQPGGEVYRLRGGHRLWAAPEVPEVTYAPDDHACEVVATGHSVRISAPPDSAGLEKSITVTPNEEKLLVDHRLTNAGRGPIRVAPWAITQLRLGGVAQLPLTNVRDRDDLQADRSLVIWPYTDLGDSRLSFASDRVFIHGRAGPPLKLGSGPESGELSYSLENWRFLKTIQSPNEEPFADRGAVCQVYVKDTFLELETLGPLAPLDPGESAEHRETWTIIR
jgi:hypothetical protein